MKNKARRKILSQAVIFGISLIVVGLFSFIIYKLQNQEKQTETTTEEETVSCSRTTRLDNAPAYDRALSIIQENHEGAIQASGLKYKSDYFFMPQLVNCIKVVEDETRTKDQAEGYFEFNSEDIYENYFPITVDSSYSYTDDLLTSLLLVHEITHVRQYLDELKGEGNLICIDQEVEAYFSQLRFYSRLSGEKRKSIDLRIEHDNNLHPQLQFFKVMSENPLETYRSIKEKCQGLHGDEGSECANNYTKKRIKELLIEDGSYQKQCGL